MEGRTDEARASAVRVLEFNPDMRKAKQLIREVGRSSSTCVGDWSKDGTDRSSAKDLFACRIRGAAFYRKAYLTSRVSRLVDSCCKQALSLTDAGSRPHSARR